MTLEEMYGWSAYFRLKGEREEKAYQGMKSYLEKL